MKPFLLLLLLPLGILIQPSSADQPIVCSYGKGYYRGAKRIVNALRTDKCYSDGQMHAYSCFFPAENRTIEGDWAEEKETNGVAEKYKCEAFGDEGISITHTSTVKIVDVVKPSSNANAGVCSNGIQMWSQNQQWDEGSFVKLCKPGSLKVEIIACRTHNGVFVSLGSNRTEEKNFEPYGKETSISDCYTKEGSFVFKEIIRIGPKDYSVTSCTENISGEKLTLKVGEEARTSKGIVKSCFGKNVGMKVIGCVAAFGNFINVGENITEIYRHFNITMNSYCVKKPLPFGAELRTERIKDSYPPSVPRPITYPLREAVTCGKWAANNEAYLEGDTQYLCQIDHRGRKNITVLGCVLNNGTNSHFERGSVRYTVPVGEMAAKDDMLKECKLSSNGKKSELVDRQRVTLPETRINMTCANGKKFHEEWLSANTYFKCDVDRQEWRRTTHIVACLTTPVRASQSRVPMGQSAMVDGRFQRCEPTPDGRGTMVLLTPERANEPSKCEQHKMKEWEDKFIKFSCHADPEGRKYVVVTGCRSNGSISSVKLGETIFLDGRFQRCDRTGEAKAEMVDVDRSEPSSTTVSAVQPTEPGLAANQTKPHTPSASTKSPKTCVNGRKQGEQWIDEGIFYVCVNDADGTQRIKAVGCQPRISKYGREKARINIGEVTMEIGRELRCNPTKDGKAALERVNLGTAPNCDGRRLNVTWEEPVDGNLDAEFACNLDNRLVPTTTVVACIFENHMIVDRRVRVSVGEIGYSHDGRRQRCAISNDGKVKLEYVPPTCLNGTRKRDEQWRDGDFVKVCLQEEDIADADDVYVAFKACLVGDLMIAVGEQKEVKSDICTCKRDDGIDPKYHEHIPARRGVTLECKNKPKNPEFNTPTQSTPPNNTPSSKTSSPKTPATSTPTVTPKYTEACPNGRLPGEEYIEGKYVMVCVKNNKPSGGFSDYYKAVACITPEGATVRVQEELKTPRGEYKCVLIPARPYAELTFTEAGKTTISTKPCSNGRMPGEEYIQGNFVMICDRIANIDRLKAVACITPEGAKIRVREELKTALGEYKCYRTRRPPYAALMFTKAQNTANIPKTCENGREMEAKDGVLRGCNKQKQWIALVCYVPKWEVKEWPSLAIGDTFRGRMQYTCEKLGDSDAKLVEKSYSQLCEEGDESVNAWVEEAVLRDCVRTGPKPIVYGRMCILNDGRIIEIGNNITDEFETHSCERKGEHNAEYNEDHSRIHSSYFTTPGVCKNGRKQGDEWTEEKIMRRACRKTQTGHGQIHEIGCLWKNGTMIPVGGSVKYHEEVNNNTHRHTVSCTLASRGFGVDLTIVTIPDARYHRSCNNSRAEGAKWTEKNVARTCKEVNDKLEVVALYCVYGNHTVEIGKIHETSDFSVLECVSDGKHDASFNVYTFTPYDTTCENGKKLNDEWTDDKSIRQSCRIREKRAAIVALGCVLDDGRIIGIEEKYNQINKIPGGEETLMYDCYEWKGEVHLTKGIMTITNDDPKSPCGDHELGSIWAFEQRFLKKCKVIEGNVLSGVTIGCVTLKETHMLEGEVVEEDDYRIECSRNEDGKLELGYSFTLSEQ